jgi:DNA-binding Lrp family transcriptional regulator
MAEFSDEDQQILEYLRDAVAKGERYFRAKGIADRVGLSSKQVGARLPRLAEESDEVEIEKWGRARSTTWRVTPE